MARVHERKARKDYPAQGIKAGDTYYTWKTRVTVGKSYHGQVHRSLTRPVTTSSSPFQSAMDQWLAGAFEGIEDADGLRATAESLREIGQEERDKFDNMPDGLQQGDTGQMLEERADNCDAWAEEIESAANDLEEKLDALTTEQEAASDAHDAWEQYDQDVADWDDASGEPEPEEPADEDPRNRDFDQERADLVSEAVDEAQGASPF